MMCYASMEFSTHDLVKYFHLYFVIRLFSQLYSSDGISASSFTESPPSQTVHLRAWALLQPHPSCHHYTPVDLRPLLKI